jgi:hypothetical protein
VRLKLCFASLVAFLQAKYAGFGMIEPRVRLDFDQLGLTLPGKGKVLEGVSGEWRMPWRTGEKGYIYISEYSAYSL